MVKCLTGIKFSMNAEVLNWTGYTGSVVPNPEDTTLGTWETYQDPITLEVRNKWVPATLVADNINTPQNEFKPKTVSCLARGIVSSGITRTGTSEMFQDWYRNIDYVQMWVPASVVITKRDRVTNIRERKGGKVIWIDEEYTGPDAPRPTIFNVAGVTPLLDPFDRHTQSLVFLERADV